MPVNQRERLNHTPSLTCDSSKELKNRKTPPPLRVVWGSKCVSMEKGSNGAGTRMCCMQIWGRTGWYSSRGLNPKGYEKTPPEWPRVWGIVLTEIKEKYIWDVERKKRLFLDYGGYLAKAHKEQSLSPWTFLTGWMRTGLWCWRCHFDRSQVSRHLGSTRLTLVEKWTLPLRVHIFHCIWVNIKSELFVRMILIGSSIWTIFQYGCHLLLVQFA